MATAFAALAFAATAACGPATPLVAVSPQVGPGAHAGPIWFVTGGSGCFEGTPLRFWYRSRRLPLPSDPVPAERLAEVGDLSATLKRGRPPIVAPTLGYGGYILFSAPGYWR